MTGLKDHFDVFPEVKAVLEEMDIPIKMNMDSEEAASLLCNGLDYILTGDTMDDFIWGNIDLLTNTGSAYASKREDHHYESFNEDILAEKLKAIFSKTTYAQRMTTPCKWP